MLLNIYQKSAKNLSIKQIKSLILILMQQIHFCSATFEPKIDIVHYSLEKKHLQSNFSLQL